MDDQKTSAPAGKNKRALASLPPLRLARAGRRRYPQGQKGIALVAVLVVIPMLFAVGVVVTTSFVIFKRKSVGQSLCIKHGVKTQNEQRDYLEKLLKMNKSAKALRIARKAADVALRSAQASGYPPAIAAAQAVWTGVYNAQIAHHLAQKALIAIAAAKRGRSNYEAAQAVRQTGYMKNFIAYDRNLLMLAVKEDPEGDDSPDYVPVDDFKTMQAQTYRFKVDLYPGEIPAILLPEASAYNRKFRDDLRKDKVQQAGCTVSLEEEDRKWRIKIIEASAPSKFPF